MKKAEWTDYVTRDSIMKLLSDDEVARVSTAETALRLSEGEDYLDLERLDRGVQQALGLTPVVGRTLPRKAVHEITWIKIMAKLAAARDMAADASRSSGARR